MLTYEKQLERDSDWALQERERYFKQQSAAHTTLRRITEQLEKLGIDYAVAGDLCMFFHGLRRYTEIVELLVTPNGLERIHRELVGSEYIRPCMTENSIRDVENGVCIRFFIAGHDPGANNFNLHHN
jgi:hypothetical protein